MSVIGRRLTGVRLATAAVCLMVLAGACSSSVDESTGGDVASPQRVSSDAEDLPLRPDARRTPDAAFSGLADWEVTTRYADVAGYRLAYVDEGPSDGEPVLMLHGVPTWGYLYRSMIPVVADAGHRVVVPDLIGFGRSDKPIDPDTHSYAFHVDAISEFIREQDLSDITLVCQDWGSLIGLRVVAEHPDRFARVVLSNGGLPVGGPTDLSQGSAALGAWQEFVRRMNQRGDLPIELIMGSQLDPAVSAAYTAPFPDPTFEVGPLTLPLRIPTTSDDPANAAQLAAWDALSRWDKPFLTVFGDADPITRGAERDFIERVPGARGQPHEVLGGASHFIQETHGVELARIINEFIAATPVRR